MPGAGGAGGGGSGGGGGAAQTTIIDIPIPKVDTTELEVVHVFPQGMGGGFGGGMGGGYGGYNNYPSGIPSFSVVTNENGGSQTSNVWGFNPGAMSAAGGRRLKNGPLADGGSSVLRLGDGFAVLAGKGGFRKRHGSRRGRGLRERANSLHNGLVWI